MKLFRIGKWNLFVEKLELNIQWITYIWIAPNDEVQTTNNNTILNMNDLMGAIFIEFI